MYIELWSRCQTYDNGDSTLLIPFAQSALIFEVNTVLIVCNKSQHRRAIMHCTSYNTFFWCTAVHSKNGLESPKDSKAGGSQIQLSPSYRLYGVLGIPKPPKAQWRANSLSNELELPRLLSAIYTCETSFHDAAKLKPTAFTSHTALQVRVILKAGTHELVKCRWSSQRRSFDSVTQKN